MATVSPVSSSQSTRYFALSRSTMAFFVMAWQSRTLISWLRAHLPLTGKRVLLPIKSSQGSARTPSKSSSKLRASNRPITSSTRSAQRSQRLARIASSSVAVKRAPPFSAFAGIWSRSSSRATMPSRPNAAVAIHSNCVFIAFSSNNLFSISAERDPRKGKFFRQKRRKCREGLVKSSKYCYTVDCNQMVTVGAVCSLPARRNRLKE